MQHHILKWLGMITWVVTSLVSINVGLRPFGYNIFEAETVMNLGGTTLLIAYYVILASGIYSLVLLAMAGSGHCSCSCCSSKNCKS
jgi:hypothetical protein